jgi:4-amino-4-deoxy-L-arabinose transferase-like glycosyltransferase
LVFRLTLRLAGSIAALGALVAFLFSPFGLLWRRTSLIEYLATALSLAFLLASVSWLEERRQRGRYVAALSFGIGAMLVKITTGAFYLLPILFYRPREKRPTLDIPILSLLAVPSLVGLGWAAWADSIKAASPATAFLTSRALVTWNFGTVEMRLEPTVLAPIAAAIFLALGGAGLLLWIPMASQSLQRLKQGPFLAAVIVIVTLGPPLALTPLYSTQNYYPAAVSPAIAMLVGIACGWGWEHRTRLIPRGALVAGVALWLVTLILTRDYWLDTYRPVVDRDGSLAAAAFIRSRTSADDWVVLAGRSWDPTVLYYAQRRGYMLDPRRDTPTTLERLRGEPRYRLFVYCPYEGSCQVLGR